MTEALQNETIAFLQDPATHGGKTVERISTHSAHIFLAGDRAYKLKRAVRLPFLDFSTVEKRRATLETELAINSRTAPSLYLSTRAICRGPEGALTFGDENPVDWVLVMRRFPQCDLLDAMATAGTLTAPIIDALAEAVVAMHRGAEAHFKALEPSFRTMALDTISELRASPLDQLSVRELEEDLKESLATLEQHLRMRAANGFVRRLHGDMHLGNIVLLDGRPTPFDALEFDPSLATGDVYYDLAFLLMDLEHRDRRPMANRLLNRYVALTDDVGGLRGLPLFMAVRAAIRAKVLAIGARLAEARQYLAMAKEYLPARPPRIIAVGGLSGTGKSKLAAGIAPQEGPSPGAIVLRSDVIRKQLHGVDETTRLASGSYTPAATAQVYAMLHERARRVLEAGYTVIVDAVFAAEQERAALEDLASRLDVPFRGLWLEARLDVRLERVAARKGDASDADARVVTAQSAYDLGNVSWARCDADKTFDELISSARHMLARR